MECGFCVEILAPAGLLSVEPHLGQCELPLRTHESGYNGKIILRSSVAPGAESTLEWDMDSSDEDIMWAEGSLFVSVADAERLLQTLSTCLRDAGLPHRILLDDPTERLYATIEHAWPATP